MSEYERNRQSWMTDDQYTCFCMLADLCFGAHHITGKVKPCGRGIECNTRWFRAATFDYDGLTRAVIMAHDRAIRFEMEPSGPGMIKLVFHKRRREGTMSERHPSLEEAIKLLRNKPEVSHE